MISSEPLPEALRQLFRGDDPASHTLPVQLPPGRVIVSSEEPDVWPVYWLSDAAAPAGLWSNCRAGHARSGLWPVLLGPSYHSTSFEPWSTGEMYPSSASRPDEHDPDSLLADWWRQYTTTDQDDTLSAKDRLAVTAPFGRRWPGLAPRQQLPQDPALVADQVAEELLAAEPTMRLGLIAAHRSADAVTVAGWSGPANYTGDTAKISAVLRSWEDRYATRVVGLTGYATLYLSVAAPPRTYQDALHIAAEHFAFCPDNIWQGRHPHTLAVTPTPRGFDHLGILVGLTAPPSEMIN